MNSVLRAVSLNILFLVCFVLLFRQYNIAGLVTFYVFGIVIVFFSWSLPYRIKLNRLPSITNRRVKPIFVGFIFILFSIVIAHLRGINIFDLLAVFSDREAFVATQDGMGFIFIVYFEIFFGFWLANFFLGKLSIFQLFLIVLLFTVLSFSRAYFFYLLVAYIVNMNFNLRNIIGITVFFILSCSILLLRFNTIDIGILLNNPVVIELFTKYPFVGIARLGVDEPVTISYYNYFTAGIMPFDFLSFGTLENLFHLDKGSISYSRFVGNSLVDFKELPILSSGELSSFNAFGTLFYPFKFFSYFSFIYLFIVSLLNSLVFKLIGVDKNQAYKVLSFLLIAGILISLFNTLVIIGILLGYYFSLKTSDV
ncbi:hypothetical protein D3C87_147670 [compost metagenome]